jgi:hypothetical protein
MEVYGSKTGAVVAAPTGESAPRPPSGAVSSCSGVLPDIKAANGTTRVAYGDDEDDEDLEWCDEEDDEAGQPPFPQTLRTLTDIARAESGATVDLSMQSGMLRSTTAAGAGAVVPTPKPAGGATNNGGTDQFGDPVDFSAAGQLQSWSIAASLCTAGATMLALAW